jgi:hypothetical protein
MILCRTSLRIESAQLGRVGDLCQMVGIEHADEHAVGPRGPDAPAPGDVPAQATRRETEREVEKVLTGLLNQVDERCSRVNLTRPSCARSRWCCCDRW